MDKNEMVVIDLRRVFRAIWRRKALAALVCGACIAAALLVTLCLCSPQYEASVMFCVRNAAYPDGVDINSDELLTARNLVDSCIVILGTRETMTAVAAHGEWDIPYSKLEEMVCAEAVSDTELFVVDVTCPDPAQAKAIADAVAEVLPGRVSELLEGVSLKVADAAVQPEEPVSPSYPAAAIGGFLTGILLSLVLVFVLEKPIFLREDKPAETLCCGCCKESCPRQHFIIEN